MATNEPVVRFEPAAKRFEARVAGSDAVAHLDVRPSTDLWTLTHVEVPPSLEGRGVGSALVRAALAHVRALGAQVRPLCPFVLGYLERHPQEADVVHERFRSTLRRTQETPR